MDYSGKIKLFDIDYDYIINDFEMTIIDSRQDLLREHKISDIVGVWLDTNTDNEKKLKLKLSYKFSHDDAVIMNIDAYLFILDYEFEREKKNEEIHRLTFRSEILDYFYRPQKNYIKNVSKLIESFETNKLPKQKTKEYKFTYNKKEFILYFGINTYLRVDNKFMFDVFSSLNIECDDNIEIDDIFELSIIVKKFLSFVSNKRKVYLEEIIINEYFNENEYKNGNFYLNQSEKEKCNYWHMISYDDINNNIGEIFNEIINDSICFVSLFQYDSNYINAIDIMNICAAFESQFEITYPNYRNKKFEKIKTEMVNQLSLMASKYHDKDYEVFKEILTCTNNYKDILKLKIEYALNEFEKLYDEKVREHMDIKFDFTDDYKNMPTRIKDARNALDHGNNKYKITYKELTDTILLRAITYSMILKVAKVRKFNIMKCIRKFTRFGV